ncbi:VTT domain-containing protein [Sphingorhabdus soli]|uniref:VTT domain-containing protein n=1 Tax=Flavisphingopyxis soli TaxID=2601267 RepID=A0A5C6U7X1_9SPHN|nr:VTT domain-containing protein [Sphingorhabdus soli]TXC69163.1 VTT domain-containing protein [Sphingorhabdus soli]
MDLPTSFLIFFAIVLAVNLMPAFGPPTWSVIVLFGLNTDLPIAPIILVGAVAAASGRFLLGSGFRLLGQHVSEKTRNNLGAARTAFERNRRNGILALILFAISPIPSAQLFEAAGLARIKLLPFTVAFFLGRIVSYTIYALTAKGLQRSSFGQLLTDTLTNPVGIAVQVILIAGLVLLTRIDWQKVLDKDDAEPARRS